jgi:hypothetical protein
MLLLFILNRWLHLILFDGRIRLQFLLDEIPQLEHRHLQNLETLLKLRSEDLRL